MAIHPEPVRAKPDIPRDPAEPLAGLARVPLDRDNAEMPLAAATDVPTPHGLFYVRSNFGVPSVPSDPWTLEVGGAVARSGRWTLEGLRRLHSHEVETTLECAGNGRRLMSAVPEGTAWTLGAVSTGRFGGVPLARLLAAAGVASDAVEVRFTGADRGEPEPGREVVFERSLPLEAALRPDVLVAWSMNGADLPPEHGRPLRLVVPRWYGVASVKWLTSIRVLTEPFRGHFQRERYVYRGESGTADDTPVTLARVRALIGWPAEGERLAGGAIEIAGTAWSGHGAVRTVEVSVDGGASWAAAELGPAGPPHRAVPWRFRWTPPGRGTYVLAARAIDAAGHRQPLEPVWNEQGYGNNVVHRVRVTAV